MYKKCIITVIAIAAVVAVTFVYFVSIAPDQIAAQESRSLEEIIEYMFHHPFSWDDYLYMLERGTPINQTLTYENFELEVLGAIAVAGLPFYSLNWEHLYNIYEETGEWPHFHDYEEISAFLARKFYFVSIRDTEGTIDMSSVQPDDIELDLTSVRSHGTILTFVHYDASMSKVYYLIGYSDILPPCTTDLSIPFAIGQVNIGLTEFKIDLGISITDILDNHVANFCEREPNWTSGVVFEREIYDELIAGNFSPILLDRRPLYNELYIHAYYRTHITNITFIDNLLLVQVREPFWQSTLQSRSRYSWIRFSIVDTRIESASTLSVIENREQRAIIELSATDFTNFFYGDEQREYRIVRHMFFVPDCDILPYLDFNVSGAYFEERVSVHFYFPGVEVPIQHMEREWR